MYANGKRLSNHDPHEVRLLEFREVIKWRVKSGDKIENRSSTQCAIVRVSFSRGGGSIDRAAIFPRVYRPARDLRGERDFLRGPGR